MTFKIPSYPNYSMILYTLRLEPRWGLAELACRAEGELPEFLFSGGVFPNRADNTLADFTF